MPGMPGMGGGASRKPKQQKAAKGRRQSGNPLKRQQQAQEAAQKKTEGTPQPGGAFGIGPGQGPSDFELPKEFKDLL
jgi:signal recognition particle subunit SRP54